MNAPAWVCIEQPLHFSVVRRQPQRNGHARMLRHYRDRCHLSKYRGLTSAMNESPCVRMCVVTSHSECNASQRYGPCTHYPEPSLTSLRCMGHACVQLLAQAEVESRASARRNSQLLETIESTLAALEGKLDHRSPEDQQERIQVTPCSDLLARSVLEPAACVPAAAAALSPACSGLHCSQVAPKQDVQPTPTPTTTTSLTLTTSTSATNQPTSCAYQTGLLLHLIPLQHKCAASLPHACCCWPAKWTPAMHLCA